MLRLHVLCPMYSPKYTERAKNRAGLGEGRGWGGGAIFKHTESDLGYMDSAVQLAVCPSV